MTNPLIDYAIRNIWCNPAQDFEKIFQPKKISKKGGALTHCTVLWDKIPLPDSTNYYHVYLLGALTYSMIGFFPEKNVWKNISSLMNSNYLMVDVYINSGIQLPRFETYLVRTNDDELILCIKNQTIADLNEEPLYIRMYSNAYFYSLRSQSSLNFVFTAGQRMLTIQDGLDFQYTYHSYQSKNGLTNLYINGILVNDFIPQYTSLNSTMELVYDSSVKKIVDFNISDLQTFTSVLDSKIKYLLHYNDPESDSATIDYRDDIDVYLIQKSIINNTSSFLGVYFHKNQNDAFRQLTHRDYSIAVPYLNNYLTTINTWTSLNDLTIRIHIRNSGYQRPLSDENGRIKELYKLSSEDIVKAMLGIDSNVSVWKAETLENSNYIKIMDFTSNNITQSIVESALGYNATSKLLANTPLNVETINGRKVVLLPSLLQSYSTIYEYDNNGLLIDYYPHTSGSEYSPINQNTVFVEAIVGKGTNVSPIIYNQQNTLIDNTLDYRFYICTLEQGVPYNDWIDVTSNNSYYIINSNNQVHWLIDQNEFATAVKSNKDFLAYKLSLTANDGLIKFTINNYVNDGVNVGNGILYIPVGKLDIWLNNHYLIPNIDYFYKWPQVIICAKKYLSSNNTQQIIIRGTGFCNSNIQVNPVYDYGFVKYEMLSRNNIFNIRDDKVVQISVGGSIYQKTDVIFSENYSTTNDTNIVNGLPYSVDNLIVPLRSKTLTSTYDFLNQSLSIDQEVSNYLTPKITDPIETNPDSILDKYPLYSPFTCKIMYDLLNNVIDLTNFKGQYSDQDVKDYLTNLGYTYILDYDPALKDLDLNYVSIQPHNLNTVVTLNIYQYNFLSRAIRVFLFDKVDITSSIAILSTGI